MINYTLNDIKLRLFNSIENVFQSLSLYGFIIDDVIILESNTMDAFIFIYQGRFFDGDGEITSYLKEKDKLSIEEDFLPYISE